jgi:hypothetical protein
MFKNKKQNTDTKRQPRIPRNETIVYSNYHTRRKTTSSALKNAHQANSTSNNSSNKVKNSKSLLVRLPSYLVMVLIIFSAGYLMTLDNNPTVVVKGDSELIVRQLADYENAAADKSNSNIFKKFKPFFSSKKMAESLLKDYPELRQADVRVPVVDRSLVIVITPEEPAMLVNDSINQYLISSNGKAIAAVKDIDSSKIKSLPIVDDNVIENIELGQYILPKTTLEFIGEILHQLKAKSISVERVALPAIANELHVFVDKGYIIKLNIQEDPTWQTGSYLALLDYFNDSGDAPKEYVDVRVGEKIFYR